MLHFQTSARLTNRSISLCCGAFRKLWILFIFIFFFKKRRWRCAGRKAGNTGRASRKPGSPREPLVLRVQRGGRGGFESSRSRSELGASAGARSLGSVTSGSRYGRAHPAGGRLPPARSVAGGLAGKGASLSPGCCRDECSADQCRASLGLVGAHSIFYLFHFLLAVMKLLPWPRRRHVTAVPFAEGLPG